MPCMGLGYAVAEGSRNVHSATQRNVQLPSWAERRRLAVPTLRPRITHGLAHTVKKQCWVELDVQLLCLLGTDIGLVYPMGGALGCHKGETNDGHKGLAGRTLLNRAFGALARISRSERVRIVWPRWLECYGGPQRRGMPAPPVECVLQCMTRRHLVWQLPPTTMLASCFLVRIA